MKYEPLVSIIVPVYNGANFLQHAIDSALAQTYQNCEILIVNDGSTDEGLSEKIALSYGEKVHYYSKKNGGVSSALNFAFEKMNGEWFSWLSHDDLYYPEKIEKQISFINGLIDENPNFDIKRITVRTATESIDKDGKVIKRPCYKDVPKHEKPIDTILNNISNYRLSGCSFILPTTCIADIGGFNESIRTVSDVEYWYRLLFAGYEFYCLADDVLVKNRSHGKQVGKSNVELFNKELNVLFLWIADALNSNPEYANVVDNERLYFGLVKRLCPKVASYVKKTYLKAHVSCTAYYLKYPIVAIHYHIIGLLRKTVRYIFRKIYVK